MKADTVKQYRDLIDELNYLGYKDQEAAIEKAKQVAKKASKSKHKGFVKFYKGEASFYEGDLGQAKSLEIEACELLPDISFIWSNLAVLFTIEGNPEQALEYYDRALELEPDDPHTLCCKGVTLSKMGREQEAIDHLDRVIAFFSKAELTQTQKKEEKFKILSPYLWQALVNKGVLLSRMGRSDDALTYFDRALKVDPDSPNVLTKKGIMLLNLDRKREAMEHFEQALLLDPDNVQAMRNKGAFLVRSKQFKQALETFQKIDKRNKLHFTDHAWITRCYTRSERFTEAVASAQRWKEALLENNRPTTDADNILKRISTRKEKKKKKKKKKF